MSDKVLQVRDAAKEVAQRIVTGDLEPYSGAMKIWKDILDPAFDPMRDRIPDDLWRFKSLGSAIEDTLAEATGALRDASVARFKDEIIQAARRLVHAT